MAVGYRTVSIGLFGTFDGRFRPVDPGIAVGTTVPTPTSGFPFGVGYQQAHAWAEEALGFWTGANASAYPVTPNSSSAQDRLAPNFGEILRRDELAGQLAWRGVDTNVGGGSQTVEQYGPFDVLVRWAADPLASQPEVGDTGTSAADAITYCDPQTRTYIITIQEELHLDKGERYYKEVIWHEFGHVVQGLVAESIGEDAYRRLNQRIFTQPNFNTGAWATRGVESFAEQFKDTFFPLRQTNNSTAGRIRTGRQLNAFHDFLQTLYVPQGPHDYIDDTVPYYGKAGQPVRLDGFPHPIPLFDYGSEFHPDYDFPVMVEIDTFAGVGVMWKWGGRGNQTPGPGSRQSPYGVESDYRRPPPAGSTVTFRARWENPLGPFAEIPDQILTHGTWPGADFAASNVPVIGEFAKPQLPIGVIAIDTGPKEAIAENETDEAWWIGNHSQGNICWSAAGPGDTNWSTFVIPHELRQVTWAEIPRDQINVDRPEPIPRYEPVYFDMRQAGSWEMTFTVPPHDGELAIQFLLPAQKKGSDNVPWPIRSYYSGTYWSVAPKPLGFTPEELPEGNLQIHPRPGGWKRSREDWARPKGQFRTSGRPASALTRG